MTKKTKHLMYRVNNHICFHNIVKTVDITSIASVSCFTGFTVFVVFVIFVVFFRDFGFHGFHAVSMAIHEISTANSTHFHAPYFRDFVPDMKRCWSCS